MIANILMESSKALHDVPVVLYLPFLTFLVQVISTVIFWQFFLIIEGAGDEIFFFETGHAFNLISLGWFSLFIFECQHYIVTGIIHQWYFTRDKHSIELSIKMLFKNMLWYHLGSVCFGGTFLLIGNILKFTIKCLKKLTDDSNNIIGVIIGTCFKWLIDFLDEVLQYIIRTAYIFVITDGTCFIESGKKVFSIVSKDPDEMVIHRRLSYFVLFMCKLLIFLIFLITEFIMIFIISDDIGCDDEFFVFLLGITYIIYVVHSFTSIFEVTVDTIFVCISIDFEENNGTDKPYFMSDNLHKIMLEIREETRASKDCEDETENGIKTTSFS
ncbi:choline transporter-like protein 1 [Chironomus tepperi]|uniref:choline transporter-like protein 1 n=1 Tax=Chironomus tepperi TaxID=113505 RepID=UPI00391EECD4